MVQYGTQQCSTSVESAVLHSAEQYSAGEQCLVEHSAVQSTNQCSTEQYSKVQFSTTQCSRLCVAKVRYAPIIVDGADINRGRCFRVLLFITFYSLLHLCVTKTRWGSPVDNRPSTN